MKKLFFAKPKLDFSQGLFWHGLISFPIFIFLSFAFPVSAAEPEFIASSTLGYANTTSPRTATISTFSSEQYVGVFCATWFSPSGVAHTLDFDSVPMRFVSSTVVHASNESLSLWYATTTPSAFLKDIDLNFTGTQQSIMSCSSFENIYPWSVASSSVLISGGNDNRLIINGTSTVKDQRIWGVGRETLGTSWTPVPTSTIQISTVDIMQGMEIPFSSIAESYHEIRWNLGATVNQGAMGIMLRPFSFDPETGTSGLIFPVANSPTSTIPDWIGNWVSQVNNPVADQTYYQRVRYTLISSTNPQEPANNFQTFNDYSSFISDTTSTQIWVFPKTHVLANFPGTTQASTTYGWLIDYSFGTDQSFVSNLSTSTQITYINYFASTPTSTTSTYAGTFTSTSTFQQISDDINRRFGASSFGCSINATSTFDFWNPEDWRCMAISTINAVASSTSGIAANGVNFVWGKFQSVFPLSVFSKVTDVIVTARGTVSTSTDMIIALDSTMLGGGNVRGHTFTFIASGTAAWVKDQAHFNYSHWIAMGIYALMFIMLLLAVIAISHPRHEQNK